MVFQILNILCLTAEVDFLTPDFAEGVLVLVDFYAVNPLEFTFVAEATAI